MAIAVTPYERPAFPKPLTTTTNVWRRGRAFFVTSERSLKGAKSSHLDAKAVPRLRGC